MRGWTMIVAVIGGLAALCWYGATGETGPMGWLNSWQNGRIGSYSRGLSFGLLCAACGAIAVLALGARAVVAQKFGVRSGAPKTPFTAEADAKVAAMAIAMNDRSQWRWRMYLAIWLVGMGLVWVVVLGWHGWDFHRRADDAGSRYAPVRLHRTMTMSTVGDGTHLALQGSLLWDRVATQTTKSGGTETQTVYVPVTGADWRPGDGILYVVRLPRSQVWALQHRADGPDAPLLVRVVGAIPTPSLAVFQQLEAPLDAAAVLVETVNSRAGEVSDARPTFDWANAKLIGLVVSSTWTGGLWVGALAVWVKVWQERRRRATKRS